MLSGADACWHTGQERAEALRMRRTITLAGLPKGTYTVRVVATLADGRKVTDRRTYRTCAAKRPR